MISSQKGKFFMLLLLLGVSYYRDFCWVFVSSTVIESKGEQKVDSLCDNHQAQIDKLEEIVRNLSELVARLESRFGQSTKIEKSGDTQNFVGGDKFDGSDFSERKVEREVQDLGFKSRMKEGNRMKLGSVTKYSPFWSEGFQFMSAVNIDSVATSISLLPFRDYEGHSKYVAVGDDQGRVYVFLKNGDVLAEFHTSSGSPVTAMLSYMSVYKNESVLVTGHRNGAILVHRVWESLVGEELSSPHIENVVALDSVQAGENGSEITILEVHHVGRSRYILAVDENGKIKVFRENGMLYGLAVPTSRPLAFLKQRLLFLTENGAGSLDLRTMKVRETECDGLNDSLVKNYAFDATERSKAYGFTTSGDLIHVLLLGDIMNFKCRVRSKRKFEIEEPLALQAIKGYLLAVDKEKVYVYNVSTQHYIRSGAPRPIFSAGIDEIKASFLADRPVDEDTRMGKIVPLIATDREKFVIIGLGTGCVGMYQSKLPVSKGESSTMLWTSPVLFFILFLFGAWQFFAKKKEALTSWGPDDPFTSTSATNGAPLGSGSGERSFTDPQSRNTDIMNMRARRYPSPSRYSGRGTSSFRPNSAETEARTSAEPNFRPPSELKFRGSNLESTGFPKRRENMFSQVVEDGN